jgi:hypothetical protein
VAEPGVGEEHFLQNNRTTFSLMERVAFEIPDDEPAFPATNQSLPGSIVGSLIRLFSLVPVNYNRFTCGALEGTEVSNLFTEDPGKGNREGL